MSFFPEYWVFFGWVFFQVHKKAWYMSSSSDVYQQQRKKPLQLYLYGFLHTTWRVPFQITDDCIFKTKAWQTTLRQTTLDKPPWTNHLLTNHPRTNHPRTNHPGTNHLLTNHPGTNHLLTIHPCTNHLLANHPATNHLGFFFTFISSILNLQMDKIILDIWVSL